MKNNNRKKTIWIFAASLFCLPALIYGLVYVDEKLTYGRSYCVSRSLLLLNMPRNPITDSKSYTGSTQGVYGCATSSQPIPTELYNDVSNNYKYTIAVLNQNSIHGTIIFKG
jgi:hypothetical protein